MTNINSTLIEDALAIEKVFRSAGLEDHANAMRVILEEANQDFIREQMYGTENIYKGIEAAININRTITAQMANNLNNNDIINILDHHIEDINLIKDLDYAPKFVKSNNAPILHSLASLISYLKEQDPEDSINNKTKKLLCQLQDSIGGI